MEQILHYVWKHKLFQKDLEMTDGVSFEVLDTGQHNTHQGPDFFNAKIKVKGEVWAGNVEIHKSSDDWFRHGHDKDVVYNSVILHIVQNITCEVTDQTGRIIPQCEIKYPNHIRENIDFLLSADVAIPCCNYLRDIPSLHTASWLNSLLLERLERKCNDISLLFERLDGSWADVFYVVLSRSMGFGLNSDAFERLALSLPLKYILKQSDSLLQIEALLFGQAGLLQDLSCMDDYTRKLKQEYDFLKNKYSLIPLNRDVFRNLRVRPTSSPVLRLAQLAVLLQNIQGVCAKVLSAKDVGQIRLLFHVNASEYWQTHYLFGEESSRKHKYIGDSSLDVMIINAVVPLVFSYGRRINDESYIERAIGFLETIKPESNSIVKQFAGYGLISRSAYDTQAVIQLKREYCEKRKCLYCRIGYQVLSGK